MLEFIRGQPRAKAVRDPSFTGHWKRRHTFCQCCGRDNYLTAHHLIGGRGGRSDEACNLLACCWEPCHMLFEGHKLAVNGHPLPPLTLGIGLSMKLRAGELTDADLARLQELNGKRLPDLLPIPEEFVRSFRLNRPEVK